MIICVAMDLAGNSWTMRAFMVYNALLFVNNRGYQS